MLLRLLISTNLVRIVKQAFDYSYLAFSDNNELSKIMAMLTDGYNLEKLRSTDTNTVTRHSDLSNFKKLGHDMAIKITYSILKINMKK